MPNPTNQEVADAYTRRALLLIRYANNLTSRSTAELSALGKQLRALLLASETPTGIRDLAALIRAADDLIQPRYQLLSTNIASELRDLIAIESAWAAQAGNTGAAASPTAVSAAFSSMLVQGAPLSDNWQRQADDFSFRLGTAVRDASSTAGDLAPAVLALGEGRDLRGGLIERAQRDAGTLNGTATDTASYAGRIATFRASGVNALQWHSVLDNRTTIGCAVRAGKLYTLDFEPIGHDVPIDRPPPRHWKCRSILLPMLFPDGPPADGGTTKDTFQAFLSRHTNDEQNSILGPGRADLWRRGVITLSDLIGQRGHELTLDELKALSG